MTFKVLVNIPLSPFTGYGNDGCGMVRALMRWGADVYLDPTDVQAPLPADVAQLLTKPLDAPFDLAIVHLDPKNLSGHKYRRAADVVVGWSMWEWSNMKNLRGHSKLRKQWEDFDALVAYDSVSAEAFAPYFKNKPLLTVQGGFWPEDWPEIERDWNAEDFYFCMVGNLNQRKNPFAAVQAFSELKNEHEDFNQHARLSLKTGSRDLHPKMEDVYPGLRIFYDVWSKETLMTFYANQHVLLAPSRGEGKNMPALEFQSTGGTVIATNWGGHKQWLDPAYNYAVDCTLRAEDPRLPDTMQAEVSVPHLKELMLHVFRNRDEVRQKAELAARVIPGMSSWDTVIERFLLQVTEAIPKSKGQKLWLLAQMSRQERVRAND